MRGEILQVDPGNKKYMLTDRKVLQIYSVFKGLPVYIFLFCYVVRVTLLFTDPAGPQNFELSRNTKNSSDDCGSPK